MKQISMLILFWILTTLAIGGQADPWSVSDRSPVIHEKIKIVKPKSSFWDQRFEYGYYTYQKLISPADGPRCGMYPTCSDYGYQAIQKHGPFIGGWMAADRFMRDNAKDMEQYPLIEKQGIQRHYDPVSKNDFWFVSF